MQYRPVSQRAMIGDTKGEGRHFRASVLGFQPAPFPIVSAAKLPEPVVLFLPFLDTHGRHLITDLISATHMHGEDRGPWLDNAPAGNVASGIVATSR